MADQSFIWTHRDGRQAAKRQLLDKLGSVKLKYSKLETSNVSEFAASGLDRLMIKIKTACRKLTMEMDHWTVDQAYNEMKQYDFYTFGGHGCFKEYVYDYSRKKQSGVTSESQTEKKAADDSGPSLMGMPIKLTKRVFNSVKILRP